MEPIPWLLRQLSRLSSASQEEYIQELSALRNGQVLCMGSAARDIAAPCSTSSSELYTISCMSQVRCFRRFELDGQLSLKLF